jgi:hypothetical protein
VPDFSQIKLQGLYTYPNNLSEVPQGSLTVASNIVIDAPGVIQSRRGIDILPEVLGFPANTIIPYQNQLIASYGTAGHLAWRDIGVNWIDFAGTYFPPSPTPKIRSTEANSNLYFTTSSGIKKLDLYNGTVFSAGQPPGLDIEAMLAGSGSGFFSDNSQVGYRVLFGIKDANQNLILGAPSQLVVVTNTSGHSDNVNITFTLPAGLTTANFYQVYRSAQTTSSSIPPSDELQLVFESNPTSTDLTNGYITFTDITPDSLRGATIYTASSQEGILQSNYPPPLSVDIATFKNCVFYANTTQLYQQNLTLLAAGPPNGVQVGDTITIAGVVFTAASSQNIPANQFQVFTSGTAAQNITNTTTSLIEVINRSSSNTQTYAYYLSSATDLPGQMLLTARSLTSIGFSITASAHGTAYNPNLPISGTSVNATQSIQQNALYFSKPLEPEAVPLVNVLFAGSAAFPIKRIIALRDSLFILKDDGIFRLVGEDPTTFYITLFDNTSKLLATESVVNLNNTVYCLTNQGVISMSDTGLSIVSRPIEGDLLTLFGANPAAIQNLTWAVSYQSDRKYIMGIISTAGDVTPTQIYIYNVFTNAWTTWALSKNCGVINPADNKLYLGDALSGDVNIERKNFNYTDYVDNSFPVTLLAISSDGMTLTLNNLTNVEPGDIFFQASNANSVITSINNVTSQVTVQSFASWTLGASTIFKAILCDVSFQPLTAGVPEQAKQFSELELFFKRARFYAATLSFESDLSLGVDQLTIVGNQAATWGQFPWGTLPWGGILPQRPIRTYIPLEKQRCSQLLLSFTHQVGYGDFIFNGISLVGRPYSTRTTT